MIINKILKIFFILIGIFSYSFQSFSQKSEYWINASVNYPIIPNIKPEERTNAIDPTSAYTQIVNQIHYTEEYQSNVGGKLFLGINRNLTKNLFVRSGFGLNMLSFKRNVINNFFGTGFDGRQPFIIPIDSGLWHQPIGLDSLLIIQNNYAEFDNPSRVGKTTILYLDIPINIGYKFLNQSLSINLGLTTSIIVYSEQYKNKSFSRLNYIYNEVVKDESSDGLTNVLLTLNAEIAYIYNQKYSVFARYSKLLNPLYDTDYQYAGKAKFHLFELGLGYKLSQN